MNNLGDREFAKLVEVAGVRRIKFHGLRHTSATLAMGEGPAEHIGVNFAEGLPLFFRDHDGPRMPEGGIRQKDRELVATGMSVRHQLP